MTSVSGNSEIKESLSNREKKELLETGYMRVFRWEDDEIALEAAAASGRFPYLHLSSQEAACFPDVLEGTATLHLYLYIRNKLLQLWQMEPNVELTVEDGYAQMSVPFNSDRLMIKRIHGFLQRYGYINFGTFHRLRTVPELVGEKKKRIIVIGAGAAGIAATQQLQFFGFEVLLLEGRKRCGGRVHTHHWKDSNLCADLGAMVVTGIEGNPIMTLMKQKQCTPVRLKTNCPIYDENGTPVDARRDKLIEEAFKRIGDSCAYVTNTLGITKLNGEEYSLQRGYDLMIQLMELRMQNRRKKYWEAFSAILKKADTVLQQIGSYAQSIEYLGQQLSFLRAATCTLSGDPEERLTHRILLRCHERDLVEAFERHDTAKANLKKLEMMLREMRKQEPSQVYMNQKDDRLFDFHMANLEFANGAQLDLLSAQHWDQDDAQEMRGSHMTVRDGYGDLFTKLLSNCSSFTKFDAIVKNIEYNEQGVKVKYTQDDQMKEDVADAVVCTIPLGLLKQSIQGAEDSVQFDPPLPASHLHAIEKLGFGNVNKIVLLFERAFWNTELNFFGRLNQHRSARGELFLFMSLHQAPILTVIQSGAAASLDASNKVLVRSAMAVLQGIFGTGIPKGPTEAVITRWHKDPFARGCYSYVAKGASGSLYDDLAEAVHAISPDGTLSTTPRIFFAGEHTNRRYPATVQGAWLSGIREAAKVADLYLGCPFARGSSDDEPDCVLLDSDDEVTPIVEKAAENTSTAEVDVGMDSSSSIPPTLSQVGTVDDSTAPPPAVQSNAVQIDDVDMDKS